MTDTNVSKALVSLMDIEPPKAQSNNEIVITDQKETLPAEMQEEVIEDYKHSRRVIKGVIAQGETALVSAITLADQIDKPSGYEAVATLMKSTIDGAAILLELQKRKAELLGMTVAGRTLPGQGAGINVERAVFVGSAAEAIRKVKTE